MNFALAHCMGSTIQTALFNSSLVVIVGWGLNKSMDLNFEVFNIVVLIMAIIVVGNFLRDQASHRTVPVKEPLLSEEIAEIQLSRGGVVHTNLHHHW